MIIRRKMLRIQERDGVARASACVRTRRTAQTKRGLSSTRGMPPEIFARRAGFRAMRLAPSSAEPTARIRFETSVHDLRHNRSIRPSIDGQKRTACELRLRPAQRGECCKSAHSSDQFVDDNNGHCAVPSDSAGARYRQTIIRLRAVFIPLSFLCVFLTSLIVLDILKHCKLRRRFSHLRGNLDAAGHCAARRNRLCFLPSSLAAGLSGTAAGQVQPRLCS